MTAAVEWAVRMRQPTTSRPACHVARWRLRQYCTNDDRNLRTQPQFTYRTCNLPNGRDRTHLLTHARTHTRTNVLAEFSTENSPHRDATHSTKIPNRCLTASHFHISPVTNSSVYSVTAFNLHYTLETYFAQYKPATMNLLVQNGRPIIPAVSGGDWWMQCRRIHIFCDTCITWRFTTILPANCVSVSYAYFSHDTTFTLEKQTQSLAAPTIKINTTSHAFHHLSCTFSPLKLIPLPQ